MNNQLHLAGKETPASDHYVSSMKFDFECSKLGFKSTGADFCRKYIAKNLPKQDVAYVTAIRGKAYFSCTDCDIGKKIIAKGVQWRHVWKTGG